MNSYPGEAYYGPEFYNEPTKENEISFLEKQADFLQQELKGISDRIEQLKETKKE